MPESLQVCLNVQSTRIHSCTLTICSNCRACDADIMLRCCSSPFKICEADTMVHSLRLKACCKQYPLQYRCGQQRRIISLFSEPRDEGGRSAPVEEYTTWPATAPPARRLIVGLATATVTALAANFLGITSSLLGTNRYTHVQLLVASDGAVLQ
jgi:hypothetical protein